VTSTKYLTRFTNFLGVLYLCLYYIVLSFLQEAPTTYYSSITIINLNSTCYKLWKY